MQAGGAIRSLERGRWRRERWATACDTLSDYPNLNRLLDGFEQFRELEAVENVFFGACCFRLPQLGQFEEFLSMFGNSFGREASSVKARACSDDNEESASLMVEGLLSRQFALKFGPCNVRPWPTLSNGKVADIKLESGGKFNFYEIALLGEGMFQEKIQTVYDIVSRSISDYLPPQLSVWIFVDPEKLPVNEKRQLDVNSAISRLNDSLAKLGLYDLLRSPGRLPTHLNLSQNLPFVIEEGSVLSDCPIASLSVMRDDSAIVHMSSLETFPSRASEMGSKSFVRHCERKIREELKDGQREPRSPNILVLNAYHWLYHSYRNSPEVSPLDLREIDDCIRSILQEMKIHDLSAVKVFEYDYFQARTIVNPFASEASTLKVEELEGL